MANELPVGVPLDHIDVHQLRVALEFISECLVRDACLAKSVLENLNAAHSELACALGDGVVFVWCVS